MIKLLIFDLDGTILNTLDDLADSMNYTLAHFNLPTHQTEKYKTFVGNGMAKLTHRALPENLRTDEYEKRVLDFFMDYYSKHSLDKTAPYENILQLLNNLKERRIKLAVVTNKAHTAAIKICEHFFGDIFDIVIGQSDKFKTKPAPDSVNFVLNTLGVSANESLFIGDSNVDMQTAHNAEIKSIGVLWGFRSKEELINAGADYTVCTPQEIYDIVRSKNNA